MNAPRLTANRLDDLEEAIKTIDADVAYLAGAAPTYPKGSRLNVELQQRHDKLVRSRDWLAGKIAAERERRD